LCVPTDKRACCSQRLPVLFRALRFRVSVLRAFITEAKGIHLLYVRAVRVYLWTRSLEEITRLHGHSCTKCQSCVASVVRCKKSHFPFSAELIYILVCSSQRMREGTRILCEEQKTPIGIRGLEHQVCKLPYTCSPTFLCLDEISGLAHIPVNLRKIVTEVFTFDYLFIDVLKMRENIGVKTLLPNVKDIFQAYKRIEEFASDARRANAIKTSRLCSAGPDESRYGAALFR